MKEVLREKIVSTFCKRICLKNKIESIDIDTSKFEKIMSHNNIDFNQKLVQSAKIIIIGTLTPPEGMENGYYYSSSKNKVFGILDRCLNLDGTFVELKKQLALNKQSRSVVKEIEKQLHNNNLAFLDIIDRAIRVKGSSKDDDILMYSLDYDHFKFCNTSQIFICTSKNAKNGLLEIVKDKDVNIDCSKIFVCYQDRFHFDITDWKQKLNMNKFDNNKNIN